MARIAYVDHSFHRRTLSTLFLPDMLRRRGHDVDLFWDYGWTNGEPVRWESVRAHEIVIMFQSYCPDAGRPFRSLHPNVIYIPMFDQFGFAHGSVANLTDFWEPFQGSKILSFSSAVHALVTGFGIVSQLARFYPEAPPAPSHTVSGLHGFFWLRREMELGWSVVRTLIGSAPFDSFHLHVAQDPGFPPPQLPPHQDLERYRITTSTWFEQRSDLDRIMRRANVYFAPRLAEGIGQSYLEAMACGQCVVAPDNPTMNEYIVHGVNGLLYDPQAPTPLDFSEVASLGQQAQYGVRAGRLRWRATEQALVDFILTPSAKLYGDRLQPAPIPHGSYTARVPGGPGSRVARAVRELSRAARAAVRPPPA